MRRFIAKRVKVVFDFHEYKIHQDKLFELSDIILSMDSKVSEKEIESFFDKVLTGRYGVLYKAPTCLTSMYFKFMKEKKDKNPFLRY